MVSQPQNPEFRINPESFYPWISDQCTFNLRKGLWASSLRVWYLLHMGLNARKPVFEGLRTTQAQTSLHIRAV